MYGVVLWSDQKKNCAVIWCEDHRNLAYFKEDVCPARDKVSFCPGDLVEFEVREEDEMRLALSMSVVAENHYPTLAEDLMRDRSVSSISDTSALSLPGEERSPAHILAFPGPVDRPNAASEPVSNDLQYG